MDEIYRDILEKLGTKEEHYVLEPSLKDLREIIQEELLWMDEVEGVDTTDAIKYLSGEAVGYEQTRDAQRLIDPILTLYFNRERKS